MTPSLTVDLFWGSNIQIIELFWKGADFFFKGAIYNLYNCFWISFDFFFEGVIYVLTALLYYEYSS